MRSGREPWPGVPPTMSFRALPPFSATAALSTGPEGVGMGTPPLSVMT